MALASTPDLASYGFGYRWGQQAYVVSPTATFGESSIRTGNTTIGSPNGKIAYGTFAIEGSNGYRQYPAYLNGSGSIMNGGSAMYGLEVYNKNGWLNSWLSQDQSKATGTIQQDIFIRWFVILIFL